MQKRLWVEEARKRLDGGQRIRIRPSGHSMCGRIDDGDTVILEPCDAAQLQVGDIVLARIKGRRYFHLVLHLIVAREPERFLIGNNFGRIDGWVHKTNIFGKVIDIQPTVKQRTN